MTEINTKQIMSENFDADNLFSSINKCMKIACEETKQACIEQIKKDSPDKTYSCTSIKNNVIIK